MIALFILVILAAVIVWLSLSFAFKKIGRIVSQKSEELHTILTDEEEIRDTKKEKSEVEKWVKKSDL